VWVHDEERWPLMQDSLNIDHQLGVDITDVELKGTMQISGY
jgi:hypothetical protein